MDFPPGTKRYIWYRVVTPPGTKGSLHFSTGCCVHINRENSFLGPKQMTSSFLGPKNFFLPLLALVSILIPYLTLCDLFHPVTRHVKIPFCPLGPTTLHTPFLPLSSSFLSSPPPSPGAINDNASITPTLPRTAVDGC